MVDIQGRRAALAAMIGAAALAVTQGAARATGRCECDECDDCDDCQGEHHEDCECPQCGGSSQVQIVYIRIGGNKGGKRRRRKKGGRH